MRTSMWLRKFANITLWSNIWFDAVNHLYYANPIFIDITKKFIKLQIVNCVGCCKYFKVVSTSKMCKAYTMMYVQRLNCGICDLQTHNAMLFSSNNYQYE